MARKRWGVESGILIITVIIMTLLQNFYPVAGKHQNVIKKNKLSFFSNYTSPQNGKTIPLLLNDLKHMADNMGLEENQSELKDINLRITSRVPWHVNPSELSRYTYIQIYNGLNSIELKTPEDYYDEVSESNNALKKLLLGLSFNKIPFVIYSKDKFNSTNTRCSEEYNIIMDIIRNGFPGARPLIMAATKCNFAKLSAKEVTSILKKYNDIPITNGNDALVYIATDELSKDEIYSLEQSAKSENSLLSKLLKSNVTILLGPSHELKNCGTCIIKFITYIKRMMDDTYAVMPNCVCSNCDQKNNFRFILPDSYLNTYGYKKCLNPKYKLHSDPKNTFDPNNMIHLLTFYYHLPSSHKLPPCLNAALSPPPHKFKTTPIPNPVAKNRVLTGVVTCSTALALGGLAYKYYNSFKNPFNFVNTTNVSDDNVIDYDGFETPNNNEVETVNEQNFMRSQFHNPL